MTGQTLHVACVFSHTVCQEIGRKSEMGRDAPNYVFSLPGGGCQGELTTLLSNELVGEASTRLWFGREKSTYFFLKICGVIIYIL